jgi:predicted DNA-binding transcriptional regulator AlpA
MNTPAPEMTSKASPATSVERRDDAYSIREFCRRNNLSEATFYRLQRQGKAPDRMKLGPRLVLITDAAAERWRLAREAEARTMTPAAE